MPVTQRVTLENTYRGFNEVPRTEGMELLEYERALPCLHREPIRERGRHTVASDNGGMNGACVGVCVGISFAVKSSEIFNET